MDILTGFRVADRQIHLVVLEGLREGAGKDIAQHICTDMSSGSLFELPVVHSEAVFSMLTLLIKCPAWRPAL